MKTTPHESSQLTFDLKDEQVKSIQAASQSSTGNFTVKTAVRAGAAGALYDCIFFARNAPFSSEYV
jgi:hypothetical protein